MTENSTREKAVVSKPGWGAVRWADLSISDASNSWIYAQSDTKNESKSIGLTSLLQKNIKLNDSINEYQSGKTIKEASTVKVPNRGFLTINSSETNNQVKLEKSNLSQYLSKVSSEDYEGIEEGHNIENQEFRFGEGTFTGNLTDSSKTDHAIKCLIQDANLNTPKLFGSLPQILNKHSNINKKRIKDHTENSGDSENVNLNSELQIDQDTIYKKIKHSNTNTCTIENFKIGKETNQNTVHEKSTQKKSNNQLSTPRRIKSNTSKSPILGTPKTPQIGSGRNNDPSVDGPASSNIDWNKRISSRLFQIAIGKGTRAYQNFLKLKPRKEDRETNDPQTPNAHIRCPQKQFTDQLNHWRKSLHQYDDFDSNILEL
ncbi:histone mRNA hairpin-binding [Cryptosporidium sp. chipmunk genotype I]|uniref:histone mRNA hairpin-binding n=1 Tax=Cryptosporidium sp. chipmunk genotype I TaxID=1280935 RepID=UPI00351A42A6|nr:histone mRNA hairpin-binding [Cryptosporidium sp. chipmunk genotype I]